MKQLQQKGFSAIEVIIVIVLLGLLGSAGWLFIHKQNESKTTASKTSSSSKSDAKKDQQSTTKTPSDFQSFSDTTHGFMFAYPKAWGDFKPQTDSTIGHFTDVTSDLSLSFGTSSKLSGRMWTSAAPTSSTGKYGATLQPTKQNNSYTWKVIEVNPANTTNKVGDNYAVKTFKNAHDITIYDFQWSDEGTTYAAWEFVAGGEFYRLTLPGFLTVDTATGDPAQVFQADLSQYNKLALQIANTIQVN